MRIRIPANESDKFGYLAAPYACHLKVGNALVKIGRGSWPCIFNIRFHATTYIEKPEVVCEIGQFCEFNESSKILIGGEHLQDGQLINTISSSPHIRSQISNHAKVKPRSKGFISIGSNVICSADSIVLSGSKISNNTLIAANAVVNDSFPANIVLAGSPAKAVRDIDPPYIEWWNLSPQDIAKFMESKLIDNPTENPSKEIALVFEVKDLRNGIVADFDLAGVLVKQNLYGINHLQEKHIQYLTQSISSDGTIEISDEVFSDLVL